MILNTEYIWFHEIETGKKGMSSETLYKVCNTFGLSADYILFGKSTAAINSNPLEELIQSFSPNVMPYIEDSLRAIAMILATSKNKNSKE